MRIFSSLPNVHPWAVFNPLLFQHLLKSKQNCLHYNLIELSYFFCILMYLKVYLSFVSNNKI